MTDDEPLTSGVPSDVSEAKQNEILAGIGGTLIIVQMAEKILQFCMTYVLQREGGLSLESLRAQTAEEAKKTLGYFLSELRKRADLEPQFDEKLKDFLAMRNQFVHNLSAVDGLGFHTLEGISIAEAFIGKLSGLAQYVHNVFLGLARAWQEQIGLEDIFADNEFFAEIDARYKPLVDGLFSRKEPS